MDWFYFTLILFLDGYYEDDDDFARECNEADLLNETDDPEHLEFSCLDATQVSVFTFFLFFCV